MICTRARAAWPRERALTPGVTSIAYRPGRRFLARRWAVVRPGRASATSFVATGLVPRSRRTRTTLASAGAVKVTAMACRAARTRSREAAEIRPTARELRLNARTWSWMTTG